MYIKYFAVPFVAHQIWYSFLETYFRLDTSWMYSVFMVYFAFVSMKIYLLSITQEDTCGSYLLCYHDVTFNWITIMLLLTLLWY